LWQTNSPKVRRPFQPPINNFRLYLEFAASEGTESPVREGKLLAVDYDPPNKGNDIVITTGVDRVEYSHTVGTPVEVWRAQRDDGEIVALEITNQRGVKTVVGLK
jgi:hypothetical protein